MIHAQGLSKTFRAYHKAPGIWGSMKSFVSRSYTTRSAVRDFDLQVQRGEMVGLLGPNGAGKTTLMKMFTGIIVPSAGELSVLGHRPHERSAAFRQKLALVMGQKSQLWWDIPAMDSFLLLQKYYEIESSIFRQRLGQLTELLDVSRLLQVHVRKLSLGERMKMELIACLLHQPEIVFLDEPTLGLDLVAQRKIREFILSWQQQFQTTVILTSHYMADVDALCDRIVLILDGGKRFDGSIRDFEAILGRQKYVTVDFAQPMDPSLPFWQPHDPQWHASRTRVDLRIDEAVLRETAMAIFRDFPVLEFSTEKLPIERVMNHLLSESQLAGQP